MKPTKGDCGESPHLVVVGVVAKTGRDSEQKILVAGCFLSSASSPRRNGVKDKTSISQLS